MIEYTNLIVAASDDYARREVKRKTRGRSRLQWMQGRLVLKADSGQVIELEDKRPR